MNGIRDVRRQQASLPLAIHFHLTTEDFVHVCLLLFPAPPKPREHLGIHAKADQLLDRPVESANLNARRVDVSFRSVRKVDSGIR